MSLALLEPGIFLAMVDVAGGLGVVILFGILPVAAFIRTRVRGKRALQGMMLLMLFFFVLVFAIELAKVLHLYMPDFKS